MKKILRFPRIEGINGHVRLCERILHRSYNQLAIKRNPKLRTWGRYDIYRVKKTAGRGPFFFTVLALQLVKQKIDPSLYIKVMSEYGQFANKIWLPPPSWLASEDAVKAFDWKHRSERNKYELEEDWKRSKRGWRERDIYRALENSAEFVQKACDNFKISEMAAITMLLQELNPWFISVYLGIANKKVGDTLMQLVIGSADVRSQVTLCMAHLHKNVQTWRRARNVLQEYLSQDEEIHLRFPRLE